MSGNTFKMGETVAIEVELEGIDTSISDVNIVIDSGLTNTVVISSTPMEEEGNQRYSYFWDTLVGYAERSGFSGWSGVSGYSWWSGTSGDFSGWSGYSMAISGIYNVTVTARDSKNRWGKEEFRIRIS